LPPPRPPLGGTLSNRGFDAPTARYNRLSVATAYDYDRLIKALLFPAPKAQKQLVAIDDGDMSRFLGALM